MRLCDIIPILALLVLSISIASATTVITGSNVSTTTSYGNLNYSYLQNVPAFSNGAKVVVCANPDIGCTFTCSVADCQGLITGAINNLTVGRTYKQTILLKGNFTIGSTIVVPSYTKIVVDGSITLAANPNYHMFQNLNTGNGDKDIEIQGGTYYGSNNGTIGASFWSYFQNIDGLTINNIKVIGFNSDGPHIREGSRNVFITNVESKNNLENGLIVLGTQNVYMVNLILYNNTGNGLMIGHAAQINQTKDITVKNLYSANNSQNGVYSINTINLKLEGRSEHNQYSGATFTNEEQLDLDMHSDYNNQSGIVISNVTSFTITGRAMNNNQGAMSDWTQKTGLLIRSASAIPSTHGMIFNFEAGDTQGTPTQYQGIYKQNVSTDIVMMGISAYGNTYANIIGDALGSYIPYMTNTTLYLNNLTSESASIGNITMQSDKILLPGSFGTDAQTVYKNTNNYNYSRYPLITSSVYLRAVASGSMGWWSDSFNSLLFFNGSNICIGGQVCDSKLTVVGNVNVSGNVTAKIVEATNISVHGYYFGQPLLGMFGSGIINSTQTNALSEVNVTCAGLVCSYNSFIVRLVDGASGVSSKYCSIAAGSTTVTDNQQSVLYVDNNCAIQITSIDNWFNTQLAVGGQWDFGNMVCYSGTCEVINGIGLEQRRMMKQRIINFNKNHLSVVSGYTKSTNTWPNWTLATGKYIYLMDVVSTPQKVLNTTGIEMLWPNSTGGWVHSDQYKMNYTSCINSANNGVTTCSNTNRWRRVFFFMVGWNESGNDTSQVHQLLPLDAVSYTSEATCLDTVANPITYTLPSYYTYSAVPLWAYCARPSDSAWSSTGWIDLRTVKVGTASSASTGNFVPYSGASQDLVMGSNNITFTTGFGINASSIMNPLWLALSDNSTLTTNITNLGTRITTLTYLNSTQNIVMPKFNISVNCTVYAPDVYTCFNGTHRVDVTGNTIQATKYS